MKKTVSLIMMFVIALTAFTGCQKSQGGNGDGRQKFSQMIIGQEDLFSTVISVTAYRDSQDEFDGMIDLITKKYTYLNDLYDIYNDYEGVNNIKTINDNAGVAPVKVSKEIIDLLKFSKEWYEKSGGKLNVAMGSVLKVWHDFREAYRDDPTTPLPDIDVLKEKAEHTDIDAIVIDEENSTVYITDPEVRIDVGAVAKGYATEIVCDALNEKYDNYSLSAGGNVKCHGKPDGMERWAIGIQNPYTDENFKKQEGQIDVAYFNRDMSLVCSGGYERYVVVNGKRYHHIIDPVTLYPEEIYRGVTIFCEDSGEADALSTAVFLSQPEDALQLVESLDGVECILYTMDDQQYMTDGAKQYLASRGVDVNTQ